MSPRGKRTPDTPFLSRTEIDAERTAAEIQELLGRNGTRRVMTEFEAGETIAISFTVMIQDKEILFRLPIRWRQYLKVLERAAARKRGNVQVSQEQARRTAWRVAKAWLEAQFSLIQSGMVELEEVMLPYVVQGDDQTLYEKLAKTGFLLEHKTK